MLFVDMIELTYSKVTYTRYRKPVLDFALRNQIN